MFSLINILNIFVTLRIPLCALINQHLNTMAAKFPTVKFLKSISTTCIPNFPDKNLPTIFIYFEGDMKKQIIGSTEFRNNLSQDGKLSLSILPLFKID